MPEQRITIKDIAKGLNLSPGTVDRALNGRGRIKEETKQMILKRAEELGYRPNRFASVLARQKPLCIVFVTPSHNPFWQEILSGAHAAAAEYVDFGVQMDFRSMDSDYDADGQKTILNEAVASEPDGIIVAPMHREKIGQSIQRITKAGIPVMTVNTDAPQSGRLAYIGENGLYTGSLVGDLFGRFMGGRGDIAVFLQNVEASEIMLRRDGFLNMISAKYPDIRIIQRYCCPDEPEAALEAAHGVIASTPGLRGFFADTVIGANAIGQAVLETGNIHKIVAVGYDTNDLIFSLLERNALLATVTQNPYLQGYNAVKLMLRLLIEKEKPKQKLNYVQSNILLDRGESIVRPRRQET